MTELAVPVKRLLARMRKIPKEVSRISFSKMNPDGKMAKLTVARLEDGSFRWILQNEKKTSNPEILLDLKDFKKLTLFLTGEEIKK